MLIDLNRNKPLSEVLLGEEINCLFKLDIRDEGLTIEQITNNSSRNLFCGRFNRELNFSFCSDELTTSLLKFEFLNLNKIEYYKVITTSPIALKTKTIGVSCGALFLEIIIENTCTIPLQLQFNMTLPDGMILYSKFCKKSLIHPQKRIHEVMAIPIFNDVNEGKVLIEYNTGLKSRGRLQTILKNLINYERNVLYFPKDVKKFIFSCSNYSSNVIENVEISTSVPNYFYIGKIGPKASEDVQSSIIPNKEIEVCLSYNTGNQLLFSNQCFQL